MTGSRSRESFIRGQRVASPLDTQGGSRMPELGPYGSVRGARGNSRPYRESQISRPSGPLMTDAVEKSPKETCRIKIRNNRIKGANFLNRSCAFDARLESMLLGVPTQNPFSTVSAMNGLMRCNKTVGTPPSASSQSRCRILSELPAGSAGIPIVNGQHWCYRRALQLHLFT
jgi:hypothetical protein